ncbi:TolC family protein [Mucilaginibacter sp. OK283]|jgi:outer membrane protein TolC|uniref:TolC family protein n=1 Tax=Mucilaginibacter sp. OK283 TaxID=1881049 RepID=UPI0008BF9F3D|nr:TolC family protein [Mucilaginibacter sp. OK283]SEO78174.1 Outer membrane protein TolC [Mucilaginibacter sp. OK283]
MSKNIIFLLLALLPFRLAAQSSWSLKTCIDYGLKNNRSNTVYANEKKIADAKAREALAAYLPSIGVTSTLDDNLKVQVSVIPAGIFGPNDLRVAFTKQFNTNHLARVDQTIYDQSLLTGLKANKYNVQQAQLNQRQNDETIIYNISTAYSQIFVYREQLNLLKANQETYKGQMEIISLRVKKGTALQKDADKVAVDYNNAQSQIQVAESNLTLAENQLKYEMGYPINTALAIDSTAASDVFIPVAPALANNSAFTADNRTDYRISQVNAKLLEIDESRIKAGALPKLTAYAQYGFIGFGDRLGPAFSGMSPYSAIGLKLNIPLFDFFKRSAQYSQAKYKRLNAQENLKLDEDKYHLDYENARTKVLKEQSNVENNRRNIQLAQSVFSTTDLQLKKGTTDLTDWLNAQNSLKEAQNNYLNSLYAFFQARIDLEKAGGTLKTFYTGLSSAHEN